MPTQKIQDDTLKDAKKVGLLLAMGFSLFLLSGQSQASDGELTLEVHDFSKTVPYEEFSKWFTFSPSLSIDRSYQSEIENIDYCFQNNLTCNFFLTEREKKHMKKNVSIAFKEEQVREFLGALSKSTDKEPTNAKFKMENQRASVFIADKPGLKLDIEKSLPLLESAFKNAGEFQESKKVSLPFKEVKPRIKAGDVNNLGINTLIGEGTSNFKGSTLSRIHNIKVSTARFDGVLLAPGEEFSFVDILGPVDGEHGYLPELVIKQDKTEPEFGGGVCQVSTTIFRAAIYAGLEIISRKNHSYAISYYDPPGMDATIYIPRPDLKFKNNTPGYILIQTRIEGTQLTFSFYGTDDGRKVEVDGPHVLQKNADGSMKTTFSQKVIDKNGKEIIDDVFNSYYDSPSKYPKPDQQVFTEKPKDWSKSEWSTYKKANNL